MIQLDGSYGEGGGQIVRNALAFSTITGRGFEISNIRKGRKKPGLKAQHLSGVKALEELCGADVSGNEKGSLYLSYRPSDIRGKDLNISIGTAGSITLLLQSFLLPCIFSGKKLNIKLTGGTDVRWSMPFDYFKHVYLPYPALGGEVRATVNRRGYFPEGEGEVHVEIIPSVNISPDWQENFPGPLELISKGKPVAIKGMVNSSSELEKSRVGERIKESILKVLKDEGYEASIDIEYSRSVSTGCGAVLWATFESSSSWPVIIGADQAGERGMTSEKVGKKLARKFLKRFKGDFPVDVHLGDNLIPLIALAGGKIKVEEISKHILSGIYVAEKFFGKIFEVNQGENTIIVRR